MHIYLVELLLLVVNLSLQISSDSCSVFQYNALWLVRSASHCCRNSVFDLIWFVKIVIKAATALDEEDAGHSSMSFWVPFFSFAWPVIINGILVLYILHVFFFLLPRVLCLLVAAIQWHDRIHQSTEENWQPVGNRHEFARCGVGDDKANGEIHYKHGDDAICSELDNNRCEV